MPDERRARLYRAVESLVTRFRTDDLKTAERYREQLSVFYDAPYTTTGEALADSVAKLYKVTGWWLRNFRDRMDYKQQALRPGELIIGLLDAYSPPQEVSGSALKASACNYTHAVKTAIRPLVRAQAASSTEMEVDPGNCSTQRAPISMLGV